jgi:hypothetical protein
VLQYRKNIAIWKAKVYNLREKANLSAEGLHSVEAHCIDR